MEMPSFQVEVRKCSETDSESAPVGVEEKRIAAKKQKEEERKRKKARDSVF